MIEKDLLAQVAINAKDSVVICKKEVGYPIIFVNKAFTKMTEYSFEEAIGKNPGDLLQGKETDKNDKEIIRNALKNEKPVRHDILNYTKSGQSYWVEVHIFPHQDYFISIQRDITNRKETEAELEEYKKFFEESHVALFRTDLETGEFLMANQFAAEMLGFENVQDLISGIKSTDIYSSDQRKDLIKKLKRGEVKDYEIKLNINGKEKWVSANMHINCNGTCIEGSLFEITSLIKLRDKNLKILKRVGKELEKKITGLAG